MCGCPILGPFRRLRGRTLALLLRTGSKANVAELTRGADEPAECGHDLQGEHSSLVAGQTCS